MHKSCPFCFAEGVDVRDEADEGTNAIDVDSLPRLPELSSPGLDEREELLHQSVHLLLRQLRPGEPLPQHGGLRLPPVQVREVT